jgi:protein-tyrosine phosphatase
VSYERRVELEGAVNFRDLGGYLTGDGQRTRWRVLFRADGLGELSEVDITLLRQLGLRTVIDLRSDYEVEQNRFDTDAHPVTFHHFPFIKQLPDADSWNQAPGLLGEQYKEMLVDAAAHIAGALRVLAAPDAMPAVFHCTAGKDRTGLLAAVLLSVLGVPEETVVADYALSGEAMARLRAKLMLKYPDGKDVIADLDEVFSADPTNMVNLFVYLRQTYGSIEGYAEAIGVAGPTVDGLRAALLEPA